MIVLWRSGSARTAGASLDFGVALDLEPASGRPRQGHNVPWRPPIEVFETDQGLVVRAEIGGLADGQVQTVVDGEELIIRGERTVAAPRGRRLYHESRIRYGPFDASVRLPFPVDAARAVAEYVDGLLIVTLPRLAPTRIASEQHAG